MLLTIKSSQNYLFKTFDNCIKLFQHHFCCCLNHLHCSPSISVSISGSCKFFPAFLKRLPAMSTSSPGPILIWGRRRNPRATAKYGEISPYSLCMKFWGNGHFPNSFLKGKWKFPFPFNFPEKTVRFSKITCKNYREI